MIELYLDDRQLQIDEGTSIGLTVSIDDIADPTKASASFTQSIDIPATPSNTLVMQHCEQVLSADIFNHNDHTARIEQDGVILVQGKAYLEKASAEGYSIQIVGNEFDWLERIRDKQLNEISEESISRFLRYDALTAEEKERAFFALVNHGCWHQEGIDDEIFTRKWATYADLIPFLSVRAILGTIFEGYELVFNGWTPDRKYITGEWKKGKNVDVVEADNSFDVTCTGNNIRTLDTGKLLSGVGVIIADDSPEAQYCEPFDTIENDENGRVSVEESQVDYIYGKIDGEELTEEEDTATHRNLTFTPTEDLTTSFVMRLKYASDFVIRNNNVVFADTVYFNGEKVAQFSMKDSTTFAEMNAGAPLNDEKFTKAAFPETLPPIEQGGSINADDMQAFYLELSNPELYEAVVQVSVCVKNHKVYFNNSQTIVGKNYISKQMVFKAACSFNYLDFGEGWRTKNDITIAMIGLKTTDGNVVIIDNRQQAYRILTPYVFNPSDGYKLFLWRRDAPNAEKLKTATVKLYKFSDSEQITIDTTILTTAYDIAGATPLSVGFGCSKSSNLETGVDRLAVIVAEGSSLSTKFGNTKPYGFRVTFNDIAGDVPATDALKAIMQLYNLRIYANANERKVYLSSYQHFHNDTVVDWRNRIDEDRGVSISYIGDDIGNKVELAYQATNPVIEHYNDRHTQEYCSYSAPLLNTTKKEPYRIENAMLNAPIFVPQKDIFGEGYDSMLTFALPTSESTIADIDYALPRTVVQIVEPNISEDPSDWVTNVPTEGLLADYEQPVMVLYDMTGEDSLNFSDYEGDIGLNQHYSEQIKVWNDGKYIECYCRIMPQEIDSLRNAGTSAVDFRSLFLLSINGEDVYCRLAKVENYEPMNATHKCTFVVI